MNTNTETSCCLDETHSGLVTGCTAATGSTNCTACSRRLAACARPWEWCAPGLARLPQLNVIGALQRLHLRAIPSSSQCSPHSSASAACRCRPLMASIQPCTRRDASSSPRAQLARNSGPNVCNARDEGGQRASSSCGRVRARVPCPSKGHRGPGQLRGD